MPPISKTVLPKTKIAKRFTAPVWAGPCGEGPNGGITFSALSRFLSCPERFRVRMIEGMRPRDRFSHRMEYGQMWHACEEALAGNLPWRHELVKYVGELAKKYPMDQEAISHWYNVCRRQFPLYVDFWKKHPDVKDRTPLFQEQTFNVPYRLPSGRVVRLRGKWDSVDLIGKGKNAGVYLQENKTKGDIDEEAIRRQVSYDLQTMIYLVSLNEFKNDPNHDEPGDELSGRYKIKGVRYNVVRRPLSGGKGSIKRHEGKQLKKGFKPPEPWEDFYERVAQYIIDEPEHYFMRWTIEVTPRDVERFKINTLDPLLERLCDWYQWVTNPTSLFKPSMLGLHFRHPFGCVNTIDEYGWTDVDNYLANGDRTGLQQDTTLFRELQ